METEKAPGEKLASLFPECGVVRSKQPECVDVHQCELSCSAIQITRNYGVVQRKRRRDIKETCEVESTVDDRCS
jgi:hypothetical protein